ncbi:chlorophyll synthesis pathway protein BchC [Rhodospirillum rubrum]|uniref:2-desacetyl-2-hydroxyethyl bacteriochlorophyllide n=2 Tax=Rhodospirillum rubrum TaxID=1085 RepID=Q2RQ19_RHORT|nr:chlorophyll synthesis pathway protein BchC [Rhodospirillum rubrum]AAN75040.1 BchC [Rhodospirillum rubrum ATCC 11170]ABC23776.1 2-desacetyl-2-hydroxyethyl bacteriochlorophyllide [Rhodospirillum rubrum ATCC 11170]AEO49516.1 2-desacetyl-2-hydroxyethyl bacteriochlorophyllide [Rhodospirillum rubrum F11]MBK1665785.1 chlorophyll synthesis pathway protein BchC [Rhodospirillum rubrum]MBK1677868.1 chlorophyll synthesis pathway protein BchC [Rhodospirillum rubrum]
MDTLAVVIQEPERLTLSRLDLTDPAPGDVVVDVEWSGISTGTERLLWSGRMPPFPGMGYPLVPGYESVGRVIAVGSQARAKVGTQVGDRVFVPGARCYGAVNGLFGGAASRVVVPADRVVALPEGLDDKGVLLALTATAYHAMVIAGDLRPELIVGHGVLGRLLARLVVGVGGTAPTVWERNPQRRSGAIGYAVVDPAEDPRKDYRCICDVSGDATILDTLVARLARGGEIVLAGFYESALSFTFPPAFMREARIRVAAEWRPEDLAAVIDMIVDGRMSLDGLITHREEAPQAASAYRTAFTDPSCLKMVLDWRACS